MLESGRDESGSLTDMTIFLKRIKSLAMLKMEKNFIAHLSKDYPRNPYEQFTTVFLFKRLREEMRELRDALDKNDLREAMLEVADLSNLCDFLFERLCLLEAIRGEYVIPKLSTLFEENR